MADIDFTYPHDASRDEARAAVGRAAQDLEARLDATSRWEGDTLRFERKGASGRIEVRESDVRVTIDLSWWLPASKSAVRGGAEELLKEHLPWRT